MRLVAGGFVPCHQGAAHVRAGPTVEAFRRLLLPIDERLAAVVDAVDDQIQPIGGFLDERVVVQDIAQANQAVEPVAALLQRPAGPVAERRVFDLERLSRRRDRRATIRPGVR